MDQQRGIIGIDNWSRVIEDGRIRHCQARFAWPNVEFDKALTYWVSNGIKKVSARVHSENKTPLETGFPRVILSKAATKLSEKPMAQASGDVAIAPALVPAPASTPALTPASTARKPAWGSHVPRNAMSWAVAHPHHGVDSVTVDLRADKAIQFCQQRQREKRVERQWRQNAALGYTIIELRHDVDMGVGINL